MNQSQDTKAVKMEAPHAGGHVKMEPCVKCEVVPKEESSNSRSINNDHCKHDNRSHSKHGIYNSNNNSIGSASSHSPSRTNSKDSKGVHSHQSTHAEGRSKRQPMTTARRRSSRLHDANPISYHDASGSGDTECGDNGEEEDE